MFEPVSRAYLDEPDAFEREILCEWNAEDHLARTLEARRDAEPFVFFEGPPTANGKPGIHHVFARTLKDSVCRFWTMRGRRVLRKAGWDTHGLPVELEVEKQLGISGKPDIEKHGIAAFNEACRNSVFSYKALWEELSQRSGYLLDYEHPYVTYDKDYIETVWFLLSRFAKNELLYRGSKVLPWCGRCGTGLSSHEVGQGYRDIDDPSVWISFPLIDAPGDAAGAALVGWTTTPWTLPSNMAACVHPDFEYAVVESEGRRYILLEKKAVEVFGVDNFRVVGSIQGKELNGVSYLPLFPEVEGRVVLEGDRRHVVLVDDFVSGEDGTGVVHLAPYGADDFRLAQREGVQATLAIGEEARLLVEICGVPAGTFFRDANKPLGDSLKERGRLVKRQQYRHSYPHCWRCDTPLIYFPAPAWFLRTTSFKERMVDENGRIAWAPPEIGAGRFGEWLENNIDWALSRDRYWGTPLPVWINEEDPEDWVCVGSFAELAELAGGLPDDFDPHRPVVDAIAFPTPTVGKSGTMRRTRAVIDCWFDSGAMPFAQYHWPFENRELVAEQFPADFICEGLDQTRGWFYTLHAISTFLTCVDKDLWASGELDGAPLPRLRAGSAYKSCMVNGLLLDKDGQKMSKRIGNTVDPFAAIASHGADSIRWSLLSGGATHLNRRYDDRVISEVRRRVLGTVTASYDFLALYARTEAWDPQAERPARSEREPLDRWILSRAAACAEECVGAFESLEPSRALRALETMVVDEVSNWYIRRSRRRFWDSSNTASQASAFATLHEVLESVVRMLAPVAPFLSEGLWRRMGQSGSVHLAEFPEPAAGRGGFGPQDRDIALESAMGPILSAASLGRAVRERVQIRVRQPLGKLLIHIGGEAKLKASPRAYEDALREELNIKEVIWIDGTPDFLQVRGKANFKTLGKRAGKSMKALAAAISELPAETLFALQAGGSFSLKVDDAEFELGAEDVLVETVSVEGLEAASDGQVTIGLATELTPKLECEGLAREVLNRVQTLRRDSGFELSDRIRLRLAGSAELSTVVDVHGAWIANEVLAPDGIAWSGAEQNDGKRYELPGDLILFLEVERICTESSPGIA
jgi:isoleucyl-tRNA synthetase